MGHIPLELNKRAEVKKLFKYHIFTHQTGPSFPALKKKKRVDKHGHCRAQWLSVQIKHNKQSEERQKQLWAIDRYTAHRDRTRLRALKNIMGQRGSSITREILPLIQPHNKSRPPETTLQPQRNSQQTASSVFTALKSNISIARKGCVMC